MGRFVCGMSVGSYCVIIPVYFFEISPKRLKKTISTTTTIFFNFGVVLAQSLALKQALGKFDKWWIIILLSNVWILISLLFSLSAKEAPVWLLHRGKTEEAYHSIEAIEGEPGIEHTVTHKEGKIGRKKKKAFLKKFL